MDIQSELHRKALEQIGLLLSNYEEGLISGEAFKVGVETVWGCLGGVVLLDDFKELMAEANAEVEKLPPLPRFTVMESDTALVVIAQRDEEVRVSSCATVRHASYSEYLVNQAADRVAAVRKVLLNKGFKEVAL